MSGKYAWHPPRPPSPPNSSIASKIAILGPIGKCLEAALEELCEQDRQGATELCDGADGESADETVEKRTQVKVAMDETMSKSICESYAQSVANTTHDSRTKNSESIPTKTACAHPSAPTNSTCTAPAALLKGEIVHYNRIGGQWRIIVKNATLMPRLVKVDVGATSRKRVMLDWNDNDVSVAANDCDEENRIDKSDDGGKKRKACDDSDVYHFEGPIQLLAYNDET
jgi:hypothetical protein